MTFRQFTAVVAVIVFGIPALVGLLWVLDRAAGTGWALPVAAMVLLAAMAVDWGAGKAKTR